MTGIATAIAVAIGATSAAAAGPADQTVRSTATKGSSERTVAAKMTRVRVTKLLTRTPDRAGNVKVRLENGKTISIPAADKNRVMRRAAEEAKNPRPKDEVESDCGRSYITLTKKPNRHPVSMRTGFDVKSPATSYKWSAGISGPGYSYDYDSAGTLAYRTSWDGRHDSDQNQAAGDYTAEVSPRGSFAVLWIGDICFSGGPTEAEHLSEPKADCLESTPDGARRVGKGWIRNTTQWVPWRNKTTNPPDGPGLRGGQATACLGKKPPEGTGADLDITGWRDAKEFREKNAGAPSVSRCHLIARKLGGRGTAQKDAANLVPCWQVGLNTGTPSMATYELIVRKVVQGKSLGDNDAVMYQVTPNYRYFLTSTIPTSVTMSATVQRANGDKEPLFTDKTVTNTETKTGKNLNLGN
ncbi:DNA/RNA non-specific endonuclease [Streptomyces sp. NPDC050658]|uniref:DNA/RNA non-specific endonuclease n=1 Tax=unclassified Streptomyces TaxID=2593676 RepID=UPI00341720AA